MSLYGTVILRGSAKGRAPQKIQTVDKNEGTCDVSPPLGDRVLHFVQACVKFLNHISIAVSNLSRPCDQKVIGRFPHGLKREREVYNHITSVPPFCLSTEKKSFRNVILSFGHTMNYEMTTQY